MAIKEYAKVNWTLGSFIRSGNWDVIFDEGGFDTEMFYGVADDPEKNVISKTVDYTPTPKDKLHLVSGVTIPRSKVKNLKEEYSIASVRDLDKATHIVLSNKVLENMWDSDWCYRIKTDLLKKWINDFLELPGIQKLDDYYAKQNKTKMEAFCLNYNEDYAFLNYWTNSNFISDPNTLSLLGMTLTDLNGKFVARADQMPRESDQFTYTIRHYIDEEDYTKLTQWIKSGLPFVDQNDIIGLLNGSDATTLDETMYESICDMFNSGDDDNHVVAMEIMANCHYRSSILYLSLLFYKYGHKMEYVHERNHVNFKALASYMELTTSYLRMDINDVVKTLRNNGSLTKTNMDKVLKYIGDDVCSGETELIKIKSVTLSESLLKELNMNYTYEYQQDYVPEVEEEVVENDMPQDTVEQSSPQEDLTIEYVNTGEIEVKTEMVVNTDIENTDLDNYLSSDMLVEKTTVTIPEDKLDSEPEVETKEDTNDGYFL